MNICQFSFRNARMISIGRGIHPYWLGLVRLHAQFLLPRDYSSFFLHLVSHLPPSLDELLNLRLRSIFTLLMAFYTRRLGRNLGNRVKPFVDDIASYGTHSIKSGAASNTACRSISANLLDMHAGWKCPTSKDRYIKHTVNDRLEVARATAL